MPQEPKQNRNPIYEGPLYENMEEFPPSLPPPPSTRRRVSGSLIQIVDNGYQSSSVPIPTGSEIEGLYAELADRKQDSQPTAGSEIEGLYAELADRKQDSQSTAGSEIEGLYAELADRKQDSQPTAPGDREEEPYIIMSPVGSARRAGCGLNSYLDNYAAWISNTK